MIQFLGITFIFIYLTGNFHYSIFGKSKGKFLIFAWDVKLFFILLFAFFVNLDDFQFNA